MIELKKLKELVKLMVDNDLTELDLADQAGERVALKRGQTAGHAAPAHVHHAPAPPSPGMAMPGPAPASSAPSPAPDDGLIPITSPMVGTFYATASPDAEPFVKIGSTITPDSVVCIVEAMKVFNEIKAEVSGAVQKILVANGQAVEFGQPLFLVKP